MIFHQTLHGYSGGHHLLATSTELDTASQLEMARLSDLSGSEYRPEAETYVTGYPLWREYYVVARTWYAHEIARSNAVWTHSLLIPLSSKPLLPLLLDLEPLFRRPERLRPDYASYRAPISVDWPEERNSLVGSKAPHYFPELVSDIYNVSERPVLVTNERPQEAEAAIDLIWARQWRSLRYSFSFCSCALNVRRIQKRPFDLQFSPHQLSPSRIRAQGADYNVINASISSTNINIPRYWVAWASEGFGDFCERFSDPQYSSRSTMPMLFEIYKSWNQSKFAEESVDLISAVFGPPSVALRLKESWIRDHLNFSVASKSSGDQLQKLWCRLLTAGDALPFSEALENAGFKIIVDSFRRDARERVLQILDTVARRGPNGTGIRIFELLGALLTATDLADISRKWPHAAAALVNSADSSALMALAPMLSTATILALVAREDVGSEARAELVLTFLARASDAELLELAELSSVDVARILLKHFASGSRRRAIELVFSRNINLIEGSCPRTWCMRPVA